MGREFGLMLSEKRAIIVSVVNSLLTDEHRPDSWANKHIRSRQWS